MGIRALDAALNAVWAMEPSALETLLQIAAREHEITPEAIEAYRAKSLANAEQAQVRNGVAIISANGPMFKRANLLTAMSGATSYEIMARDLHAARDDPKVKAAILNLDTPGGEASGVGELAGMVRRFGKPIVAYVNGTGASAGYWLAAACDEIVVDAQAVLGSIGVQMALSRRDDPKGVTTYTFISSQSPMKNADPGSKEGAQHIQGVVDAMAQVFVEAVASYRGVATETVLSDFGRGGILVGQDAVKAGLADRVGSFEGVLAELSAGRRKTIRKATGAKMSDEATTLTAEQVDARISAAVTAAVNAANARAAGIHRVAAGFGLDATVAANAIAAGATVEAFALEHADAAAKARQEAAAKAAETAPAKPDAQAVAAIAALKNDEDVAAEAAASMGEEPNEETAEAVAARIAAA